VRLKFGERFGPLHPLWQTASSPCSDSEGEILVHWRGK
jgi:hypothetical protein